MTSSGSLLRSGICPMRGCVLSHHVIPNGSLSCFYKVQIDQYVSHWWADASINKFPANISSIGFGLHQRKIMSYSGYEDKQGLELRRKATWRSIKVVTGTFFTQTQTTSLSPSRCSFIHLQESILGREGHLPVRVSALFPCKSSPAVSQDFQ